MQRIPAAVLVIVAAVALSACVSPPAAQEVAAPPPEPRSGRGDPTALLTADLQPRSDGPVFMGVSNRLRNREEEIAEATRHIADQASRFAGLTAVYQYVAQRDAGSVGYLEDIQVAWDTDYAESLVDQVEVISTRQGPDATYVIGRVPGLSTTTTVNIGGNSSPGALPQWARTPPSVPGYLVAVGVSRRNRRVRETVDTADQEALKAILLQAGTTVRMIEDRRSQEARGTQSLVTTAETARARLSEFDILARYVSADGVYLYSLAIAREES